MNDFALEVRVCQSLVLEGKVLWNQHNYHALVKDEPSKYCLQHEIVFSRPYVQKKLGEIREQLKKRLNYMDGQSDV